MIYQLSLTLSTKRQPWAFSWALLWTTGSGAFALSSHFPFFLMYLEPHLVTLFPLDSPTSPEGFQFQHLIIPPHPPARAIASVLMTHDFTSCCLSRSFEQEHIAFRSDALSHSAFPPISYISLIISPFLSLVKSFSWPFQCFLFFPLSRLYVKGLVVVLQVFHPRRSSSLSSDNKMGFYHLWNCCREKERGEGKRITRQRVGALGITSGWGLWWVLWVLLQNVMCRCLGGRRRGPRPFR